MPTIPITETNPPAEPRVATRLLHSVIVKTILELILICVVVSFAAFSNFNPQLRGAIDAADQTRVAGWAYDPQTPGEFIEVQLFIDGQFAAARRADERREDLVRARATENPAHGFSFTVEPLHLAPGRHTAQVYAVRRATGSNKMLLPLVKDPLTFHVSGQ